MKKRILAILTVILAFATTAFCVACNKEDVKPKESYTLVINNDSAKGTVTVSPEAEKYESGSVVKITVSANEGYVLESVIVNGKNITIENSSVSVTIEKNTTVDVLYKADSPEKTYTLTIENDDEKGTVSLSPWQASYESGTQVVVKVAVKGDNVLESFTVVGGATYPPKSDDSITVTITQNTVIKVNYKQNGGEDPEPPAADKYTLSINNDEEKGTVSLSPEQEKYDKNTKVTITVTPKEGYTVENIIVNGDSNPVDDGTIEFFINSDTSVIVVYKEKPAPDPKPDDKGNGTKENPYRISTAEELFNFAAAINSPENNEDKNYSSAYFRLANDIDMTGVRYNAAGVKPAVLGDKTLDLSATFTGTFDGAGHTIKNLTISRMVRSDIYYVGLFGYTYMADIHDLTIENISYEVESTSDKTAVGAAVGGVVGYAHLTNLTNVNVSGTITTRVGASNTMYIGGIAGVLNVSDEAQAYIAYIRNCNSTVKTEIGKYDDGEQSSLDSGINGGVVGYVNVGNGAVAIVNCSSAGSVVGGKYLGGIVAYINGSNVSVINCLNYAPVRVSVSGTSYVGGILGFAMGDITLMDCYSKGVVVGSKSGSSVYYSYAGGIAGFTYEDDYEGTYDPGAAVINCYYSSAVRTYDVKNDSGEKIEESSVTAQWLQNTLTFDMNGWEASEDGKYRAKAFDFGSGHFRISYYKDGAVCDTADKAYSASGYSIIGVQNDLPNENSKVFFDWAFANGVRYRYYVPVVKDMNLLAVFGDVNNLVGVYSGKGEFHGEKDGGILVINEDGTCSWVMSGNDSGTYKTDGTHIIFDFNAAGTLYGKIVGENVTFSMDYGMSGEVPYTFTKTEITVFGDYYSDSGDMLTFTDKNITFQSANVNDGVTLSGTYTLDGDVITVTCGSTMQKYYSSAKITVNKDLSLTVSFVGANGTASLNGVRFGKLGTPDYSGEAFLGSYYLAYISATSDKQPTQSTYKMEFLADGSATYTSELGTVCKGNYYLFNGNTIKLNLENNVSTFTFDSEKGIVHGLFIRGMTANNYVVLTPEGEGSPKGFMIDAEKNHYVLVNSSKAYYVNGSLDLTATISAENNFADGDRVAVNGKSYRAAYYYSTSYAGKEYVSGYGLTSIGAEEGSYKNGPATVVLDGIGGVTGSKTGTYVIYDTLVVVIYSDNTILGFDYEEAKNAGNVITEKTPDKYQGVWTQDKVKTLEDDNGDQQSVTVKAYYKFIFDGFGHVAYMYVSNYEQASDSGFAPVYKYNWGVESAWANYVDNGTGLYVKFNVYNEGEMLFYYDMNLLYVKFMHDSRADEYEKYVKIGYTGTTEIPTIPEGVSGSYNGSENGVAVVLNLKADLNGSYKGMPFNAVYDGNENVIFKLNGVTYVFDINAKTISYNGVVVELTRSGEVTEVIPAAYAGEWSGTWTGTGTGSGDQRPVKIEVDGTVTYNNSTVFAAEYDPATGKITGTADVNGDSWEILLTWNESSQTFSARIGFEYDGEFRYLECSELTKVA